MSESAGVQQGSPAIGAAGSAPAAPGAGGTEGSGATVGSARIAAKKAQLRSSPRPKKLEKLGVYSSCKVVCRPLLNDLAIIIHFSMFCKWIVLQMLVSLQCCYNASAVKEAIAAQYIYFFISLILYLCKMVLLENNIRTKNVNMFSMALPYLLLQCFFLGGRVDLNILLRFDKFRLCVVVHSLNDSKLGECAECNSPLWKSDSVFAVCQRGAAL